MSGGAIAALGVAACLFGDVACTLAVTLWANRRVRLSKRAAALKKSGRPGALSSTQQERALRYAALLTRRLFVGSTEPLAPSVRARRAGATRAGAAYKDKALRAGCAKEITVSAYCEACLRLSLVGIAAGVLLGAMLSWQMAILLGVSGFCIGRLLMPWALRRAMKRRAIGAELHLSEMLEVVALGLRSGLTFDRSFALYGSHFDNEFARSCTKAYRSWTLGLCSREEALREFAASYDCDQLSRIVDSVIRSLRFGSALAGILEEAGAQARASYRADLEERVAKAPVKMMLPTGTLILPAMLLLVMGPVLLELAGGF